jgi:hypothetical protein
MKFFFIVVTNRTFHIVSVDFSVLDAHGGFFFPESFDRADPGRCGRRRADVLVFCRENLGGPHHAE